MDTHNGEEPPVGEEDSLEAELIEMGKRNVSTHTRGLRYKAILQRYAQPDTLRPRRIRVEDLGGQQTQSTQTRELDDEMPRRMRSVVTQTELERLFSEFVRALDRFAPHLPHIDFETFSRRVLRHREHVGLRHGTRRLEMYVDLVEGRPLVVIRPML